METNDGYPRRITKALEPGELGEKSYCVDSTEIKQFWRAYEPVRNREDRSSAARADRWRANCQTHETWIGFRIKLTSCTVYYRGSDFD